MLLRCQSQVSNSNNGNNLGIEFWNMLVAGEQQQCANKAGCGGQQPKWASPSGLVLILISLISNTDILKIMRNNIIMIFDLLGLILCSNWYKYVKGVHPLLMLPPFSAGHGSPMVGTLNFYILCTITNSVLSGVKFHLEKYYQEYSFQLWGGRYKSRSYRARAVREPRAVLREFGLKLPIEKRIIVHDSTADVR